MLMEVENNSISKLPPKEIIRAVLNANGRSTSLSVDDAVHWIARDLVKLLMTPCMKALNLVFDQMLKIREDCVIEEEGIFCEEIANEFEEPFKNLLETLRDKTKGVIEEFIGAMDSYINTDNTDYLRIYHQMFSAKFRQEPSEPTLAHVMNAKVLFELCEEGGPPLSKKDILFAEGCSVKATAYFRHTLSVIQHVIPCLIEKHFVLKFCDSLVSHLKFKLPSKYHRLRNLMENTLKKKEIMIQHKEALSKSRTLLEQISSLSSPTGSHDMVV